MTLTDPRPVSVDHLTVDHLAIVRQRLHRDFDVRSGPAEVDAAIAAAERAFAHATVEAFVPLLVERHARAHLTVLPHRVRAN